MDPQFQSCIAACNDCAVACNNCAANDVKAMARCIVLDSLRRSTLVAAAP